MKNKFGKTIKIFLIDGNPNGRMTCELSSWTGKAYKIPRIEIKNCFDRNDLQSTGIYLLFGRNDENQDLVYIGEAENILIRLNQHLGQKDFWTEAITFISKDENLNKAHIKYLEYRLYQIAKSCKRYQVLNGNTPTQSSISELDKAEMEEFIVNIQLLVNTLGHKVFVEKIEMSLNSQEEMLFLRAGENVRECNACGKQTNEGFLVLKGSKISQETVASVQNFILKARERLIKENIIRDFVFTENYLFSSPSTASAVIMGRNANGLVEWKNKNKQSLKDLK